jgi:hypothetical protein
MMPALSLIPKAAADGATPQRMLLPLSSADTAAVVAWWQREPNSAELAMAQDVLQRMRTGKCWMVCGCRADGALPMLAVFKRDDEVYLRRMPERAPHDERCVFFREHAARADTLVVSPATLHDSLRRRPAKPPAFYELEDRIGMPDAVVDEKNRANKSSAPRAPNIPSMARRMFWMLDAAGAHRFPQYKDVVRRLIETAKGVGVGEATLDEFLFFSPAALSSGLVERALRRCRDLGIGDYVYLMTPVIRQELVDGRSFSVIQYKESSLRIEHAGTIARYGNHEVSWPQLGFFQIDGSGRALAGYLHPIYKTDYWCPVDSDLERRVLGGLWKCVIEKCVIENPADDVSVSFEKPIYAEQGIGVLPDLMITLKGVHETRTIAVEVIGFDDPEYRSRKMSQREELRERYDVAWIDGTLPTREQADIGFVVAEAIDEMQFAARGRRQLERL